MHSIIASILGEVATQTAEILSGSSGTAKDILPHFCRSAPCGPFCVTLPYLRLLFSICSYLTGIIFTRDVVLDSTSDNKKIFHVYGRVSTKGLDVGLTMKFGNDAEAKLLAKVGREIALGFAVAKNVEIFGSTFKAKGMII